MGYEVGNLPLKTLLPAIGRAEDQLARLDEVVRRSPVGQGYAERAHFSEVAASMWVAGELVHLEDLVLHDAERDVRTPTHEITIARSILGARRRIASREADWATSNSGIASLTGKSPVESGGEASGAGREPSFEEVARNVEKDEFAAELAEIDAILDRSARMLDAAEKRNGRLSDPLMIGELVVRDPEWDEDGRLLAWRIVAEEVESLPVTLAAAVLWDAWEGLEPLERQHWLGAQLLNSYFRSREKVTSHLFCFSIGLKIIPRERRRSSSRIVRLQAALDGMANGAGVAMKEITRLGQAKDQLERKLRSKRSSSSLPGVVKLLMATPIVSASMIVKELKVSHRAALDLVAELGVREVTGSFRAWGII